MNLFKALFKKSELSGEYCTHCGRPTILERTDIKEYDSQTGALVSTTYVSKCLRRGRFHTHDYKTIKA